MKPVIFPQANVNLHPPPGTEDYVSVLPIWSGQTPEGHDVKISCWELSDEEIEQLLKTRKIWLYVHAKRSPPPVALSVDNPFE